MARHICDNCGSAVGDDHQFCPECGSWIDPTDPGVDEQAEGDFEEFSLTDEPAAGPIQNQPVRFPRSEIQCPSCGSPNPANNRHCEECGARLSQGPLPVAPRPAVQATAGVRAAMAIAGLLAIVVIGALVFNIFSDDETTPTTLADDTTVAPSTTLPTPEPLSILTETCSISGLASLGCDNLTDDDGGEYQFNWDTREEGTDVVIELILAERSVITGVVWTNLAEDDDGLRQNYRAQSISINGGAADVLFELQDQGGAQALQFASMGTLAVTITVNQAYLPVPVGDRVFSELAIQQIELIGYPAADVSPPTSLVEEPTTDGG